MLRTTTTRPILKSLLRVSAARFSYSVAAASLKGTTATRSLGSKRPQALHSTALRPGTITLLRYATAAKSLGRDDAGAESKKDDEDIDMLAGIKGDLATIKDTFRLGDVPRESFYIGAAGVLPYLATSLSTVYLSWDINRAHYTGSGVLFSPETAHQLLAIIEPIQIGYGAVIISFLGAIHWGLEYAGYGGHHGYSRYALGVIAPAIAWPTTLMPVEYALISQFMAFNLMYFLDTRASVRGWAPPWYATYRFVLTFVVGASIVLSLVGRGQILMHDSKLPGPADKMKQLRDSQWENLEREERERRAQMAKDDEEEEGEDE